MPENDSKNPQKWLIVFLIYADFTDPAKENDSSIIVGMEYMLNDIITTTIDPSLCRLFVMMDSSSYKTTGKDIYIRNSIDRYEICRSATDNFNEIRKRTTLYETIQELDQQTFSDRKYHRHNFQGAKSLSKILKNIEIKDNEEVLFVTWDHGAGFGIFRDEVRTSVSAKDPLPSVEAELNSHPFLKDFWNFPVSDREQQDFLSTEESNEELKIPDILDNSELADALRIWLEYNQKKQVGVLLMMNCWMMNLHTIYAVKDIVKCLVAPQAKIGNPGYNYQAIISSINSTDRRQTPNDVAVTCVNSRYWDDFKQRIQELKLPEKDTLDSCAVFAIDLQATIVDPGERIIDAHFNLLSLIFNQIHSDLKKENEGNRTPNSMTNLIGYTRPFAEDISDGSVYLVDMFSYFTVLNIIDKSLSSPLEFIALTDLTRSFVSSVYNSSFLIGNSILQGKNINEPYYAKQTDPHIVFSISGYSLFFRKNNNLLDKLSYNVRVDKLMNAMPEWREILDMLYGKELHPA